jgi:hypothetical protein
MTEGTQPTLLVILADEVTSGQLRIPIEAFAEFCERMDNSLAELEQRWATRSAPCTYQRKTRRRRHPK